jgi:putative tryptophan/tyrosine transport system substrate-binding protein
MRRREFITLIGGATSAWPLAARPQDAMIPVIGFINSGSPNPYANLLQAFRQGLNEAGYVEGKNVTIEYRWAEGLYDRLPVMAADLVRRQVAVILASSPPAIVAAKTATTTIPIVFTSGGDPIELGFVSSLSRPTANVTGVSFLVNELAGKRLELLHELMPKAASIGLLVNPIRPSSVAEIHDTQRAAKAFGMQLHVLIASSEDEIDAAFEDIGRRKVEALLVGTDPFYFSHRNRVVTLAARMGIPTIYNLSEWIDGGGLMSYGPSSAEVYRQAGVYAGKILKGAKPADLPVVQPTKFELVINLKTAKTLGLTVPDKLIAVADKVIE